MMGDDFLCMFCIDVLVIEGNGVEVCEVMGDGLIVHKQKKGKIKIEKINVIGRN